LRSTGQFLSSKSNNETVICRKVDGTADHHVKWNESNS
jgi:hypothetical protein